MRSDWSASVFACKDRTKLLPIECKRGRLRSSLRSLNYQRLQSFDRQRQMRATLVIDHRMNLIDDQRAHGAQDLSPTFAGEQDVKRFGRRDDDVRRLLSH